MNIKVLDTTLRDGEQTPGVSLTPLEKLRIASKLEEIGIDFIEAGSAITSEGERESIKEITKQGFNAEILSFSRPLNVDIDYCLECDVDAVNLVVPTSDLHISDKLNTTRDKLIDLSNDAIDYCKDHGLIVEISAEDASRSDVDFLREVFLRFVCVLWFSMGISFRCKPSITIITYFFLTVFLLLNTRIEIFQ